MKIRKIHYFLAILFTAGAASHLSASVVTLGLPSEQAVSPEPAAILAPFTYNGTTVGGPTFNRPLANGNSAPTSLSGVGTAVAYDTVTFSVASAGTYSFLSLSTTTGYDNYTVLYSGSFNPASPLTNVLIANDDLTSTSTSGFTYNLNTGTQYVFVTTGFANNNAGTFTDTITQTAVPEPSSWALLSLGTVGAGMVALRRRQKTA